MDGYRLYNVVPQLFNFIEDLTNWYIRLNRSRFWGEKVTGDKISAYSTLYSVLLELSQVMAPFAPFLSEYLYRQLAALSGRAPTPVSVHVCDYPKAEENHIKPELEEAVDRMQQVLLLGRQKREEVKIGLRTPLASLTIINRDGALLAQIEKLDQYIRDELNVGAVAYSEDEGAFIELVAKPNFPLLGKRLGKQMKTFSQAIRNLSPEQIVTLQETGEVVLQGERFSDLEIQVFQQARSGTNTVSNSMIAVDLDCRLTPELIRGGYAREMVNRMQRARKEQGFDVSDRITVTYTAAAELGLAAAEYAEYIKGEVLAVQWALDEEQCATASEIDGLSFSFTLLKAQV